VPFSRISTFGSLVADLAFATCSSFGIETSLGFTRSSIYYCRKKWRRSDPPRALRRSRIASYRNADAFPFERETKSRCKLAGVLICEQDLCLFLSFSPLRKIHSHNFARSSLPSCIDSAARCKFYGYSRRTCLLIFMTSLNAQARCADTNHPCHGDFQRLTPLVTPSER